MKNIEYNITGKIFGDMKVLKLNKITDNYIKIYEVECIKCGKIKYIQYSRLKKLESCKHSNKQCGIYLSNYDKNIGLTVNDYSIVKYIKNTPQGLRYIAKCNICEIEFETYISNFKRGYGTKHEECTHHIENSNYIKRFRKIYSGMRYRTTNENYDEYYLYGGRGINSDYYKDFMIFYKDLFKSYCRHVDIYGEKNTTLDRIDVNGNYELKNCRWATMKEQSNNKRNSVNK